VEVWAEVRAAAKAARISRAGRVNRVNQVSRVNLTNRVSRDSLDSLDSLAEAKAAPANEARKTSRLARPFFQLVNRELRDRGSRIYGSVAPFGEANERLETSRSCSVRITLGVST
jgi:hypothetical protein